MLDLNELKEAVDNGNVDRDQVRVVMRDGKIVDFLLKDDMQKEHEEIRMMSFMELLVSVFDIGR